MRWMFLVHEVDISQFLWCAFGRSVEPTSGPAELDWNFFLLLYKDLKVIINFTCAILLIKFSREVTSQGS